MRSMKRTIFTIAFCLMFFLSSNSDAGLRFHFIEVGHGDAILIEEDGEGIALIDAGRAEAGRLVLEYLRDQGIESLDHLFVTHTHDDHIGGVPMILDSINVGIIHHTGMEHDWETAKRFREYLYTGNWLEEVVDVGDIPLQRENLSVEVLSPLKEETEGIAADPNPHSMVLLAKHGSVQVLLTADIYREREDWLIDQYGEKLKCQVMKASHHASRMGNSADFLKTVQPEIVIVTVGPNQWGYPAPETMERLKMCCPIVLRTDMVGTVVLESDGKEIDIVKPEGIEH